MLEHDSNIRNSSSPPPFLDDSPACQRKDWKKHKPVCKSSVSQLLTNDRDVLEAASIRRGPLS